MHTEVVAADKDGIARAVALLQRGEIVAFPTETVYGLGAAAHDEAAVLRVFAAKGRPPINPLIVHVLDLAAAAGIVRVDDRARHLAAAFWPGPLTLVLPCRAGAPIAPAVRAGLPTVAVRAPSHPAARALLTRFGRPIAAPSANRSGALSPTRAEHVLSQLGGRIPLILEAGASEVGLESTVLDLAAPDGTVTLLRPGAITQGAIEAVVGPIAVSAGDPDQPTAPGQLLRHYAPSVPVRLGGGPCGPTEAWLGFGPGDPPPEARASLNLSVTGDLEEAARNLYHMLQALDRPDVTAIVVAPIPNTGLGAAILDRLQRAAAATTR